MVYLIGIGRKTINDIWAGREQCPICGEVTDFHLYRVVNRAYMFCIPFLTKTVKRLIVCDKCQQCRELNKNEYNNIKKAQKARMKNGEFPLDVIIRDYDPKSLKFGLKIFLLVLASIFAFCMILSIFGAVFGIVPLIFAIRSVADASFKRKLYISAKQKQQL